MTIRIRVCATYAAPPARVWAVLEPIETHTAWMRDAVSIEFVGAQRRGIGTEFSCLTRVGPLSTTDRFAITAWEPGVRMGIEHGGAVTGTGELHLEPAGVGTRLCWTEELRFPWQLGGVVGERLGRPVLRALWRGNLERLRSLVDG
jgi:hypothetical protein